VTNVSAPWLQIRRISVSVENILPGTALVHMLKEKAMKHCTVIPLTSPLLFGSLSHIDRLKWSHDEKKPMVGFQDINNRVQNLRKRVTG
jgi:hypothetical protein